MTVQLRDHTFLGITQSLCPECLTLVTAKIIVREGRVYFRKHCPTHGEREDFVCSDVRHFDRMEFSLPGKIPHDFGVEPDKGCPYDCGLCTEHEQHTCVGLVEITSSCNLECPMCYAASGPGGQHLSLDACRRAIDRLVEVEGRPEVLQISGGEPTIHPQFLEILDYACAQPIDVVMINTNGIRLAHDPELVAALKPYRKPLEVYLQFDGFDDKVSLALRGESLVATKLRAIELLGQAGIRITLVSTLQPGVNDHEIGAIIRFAVERPWITGVSLQPATYSGRSQLPEDLDRRITFPDVVKAIAEQTDGLFRESDFLPLPCAHPNCHTLTYAYRAGGVATPLARFIDAAKHPDLFANGITFTRDRARKMIEAYLAKIGCGGMCGPDGFSFDLAKTAGEGNSMNGDAAHDASSHEHGSNGHGSNGAGLTQMAAELVRSLEANLDAPTLAAARDFFSRVLTEQLASADVFRIVITSFLDAYNFDVRRLMKCCIHHVLPSGHVIPFCAYNVLYRDGHVQLPALVSHRLPVVAASRE